MIRVLHCSDLHFGKRHGRFDEDLRGRLSEARFGQIDRLAAAARNGGATHVLVAGDVFDNAAPSAKTRRRVLQAVANSAPLIWVFMPGNHDPLSAETLWADLASDAPDNLTLALENVPMALGDDLDLLPAPCTTKRPGRDLTAWMDQAETRVGVQRLGLAHGAVVDFDERGGVIASDRAQRANLAYLALGDWHGQLQVNPRCWYSGAAELDRFKANQSLGQALLVALDGGPPVIEPVSTGAIGWDAQSLAFAPGEDAAATLLASFPTQARADHILRRRFAGRITLSARAGLNAAIAESASHFASLEVEDDDLITAIEAADLDAIDHGGALRAAADALFAQSEDAANDAETRATARRALDRLHDYLAAP